MAFRFRKRGGARRTRRRGARKGRSRRIRHLAIGVPNTMTTRLKYVDWVTLTANAGTPQYYAFSTNSCYDPNVTGTGHQPGFFDQLSAMYQKYIVLGSKFKARFVNTSNVRSMQCGILVSNATSVPNVWSTVMEQHGDKAKNVFIGPTGSNNVGTVTAGWSLKKELRGVRGGSSNYGAAINANPTTQNYFLPWFFPDDLTT